MPIVAASNANSARLPASTVNSETTTALTTLTYAQSVVGDMATYSAPSSSAATAFTYSSSSSSFSASAHPATETNEFTAHSDWKEVRGKINNANR